MDYKVEILIKDIAKGDVEDFVAEIVNDYGDQFERAIGNFNICVSERPNGRDPWFPTDINNDG